MNLKIYQTYYKEEQMPFLEKGFTPFDNTINEYPELREYPIILKLYEANKNYDGYWGLFSWKWRIKCGISGEHFISWIKQNPGCDIYHINPYMELIKFKNTVIHGNYFHPGMSEYFNMLLKKLGYDLDVNEIEYPLDIYSFCSFYVGNSKFWNRWIEFCNHCIEVSSKDEEMNKFLYIKKTLYAPFDNPNIEETALNFPFVIERLVSLFLFLNYKDFKIKHYPYNTRFHMLEPHLFANMVTHYHEKMIKLYTEKQYEKSILPGSWVI